MQTVGGALPGGLSETVRELKARGLIDGHLTAGAAYALAESNGPSGYAASAWSCNGGNQSGSSITLSCTAGGFLTSFSWISL